MRRSAVLVTAAAAALLVGGSPAAGAPGRPGSAAAGPAAVAAPAAASVIGPFLIRIVGTGMCLEVAGSSTANAALIQQAPCVGVQGAPNQRWTMDLRTGVTPGRNSWVNYWVNQNSGKCLDISTRPSLFAGALAIQWDCETPGASSAPTTQKWQTFQISTLPDGRAVWISRLQGLCLTPSSSAAGAVAQVAPFGPPEANKQYTLV
ncbi:MAG TPA: RICIN domain-containing protein [Mycobacteriales bacterium]|nr:RICIN domain-containing protein [Mycobacteriales bacterium]